MICGLAMLSFFGPDAPSLGVTNGQLQDCPNSPNCVSSTAESEDHSMPPIPFAEDADSAQSELNRLKEVIAANFPRATLITEDENYLRYEFRTFVFRFPDDVEFLAAPEDQLINFRSASRIGKSDLGANRKRMKKISGLMEK